MDDNEYIEHSRRYSICLNMIFVFNLIDISGFDGRTYDSVYGVALKHMILSKKRQL